jgi:hypothetical protein
MNYKSPLAPLFQRGARGDLYCAVEGQDSLVAKQPRAFIRSLDLSNDIQGAFCWQFFTVVSWIMGIDHQGEAGRMDKRESVDFYQVDSLLTGEERAFRDKIRKFVDDECLPIIAEYFDKGTFPLALIPRMASLGLFGIHFDGYGCTRASHTIYGLACRELGRCDSGLRAMFSVQNSLAWIISTPCPVVFA